jgi:hypothetical protein
MGSGGMFDVYAQMNFYAAYHNNHTNQAIHMVFVRASCTRAHTRTHLRSPTRAGRPHAGADHPLDRCAARP